MSPALLAYRLATGAAEPWLPALLRARARRGKEDAARLPERLARAPVRRPSGPLVWLHGASVGETLSLLPLAELLADPDAPLSLLLTCGTVTAMQLLERRAPRAATLRFAPADAPGVARRFVCDWRPDVAVFAESEVWPNLLLDLRRAGARTALVSARPSPASVARWARAPGAAREVFGGFDLVLAQEDASARGLARLGARDDGRLNLKLTGGALPVDPIVYEVEALALFGAPLLVAASTHPGEDEIVLDAFLGLGRTRAALAIVPRHVERAEAIQGLAKARGLACTRVSQQGSLRSGWVNVIDRMGELGAYLKLARGGGPIGGARAGSVFVGGSLVPGPGGHNPLEPVRAGAPFVVGPHVENWREVYARLGDAAPVVTDAAGLARAWAADLDVPEAAAARAARAFARLGEGEALALAAAGRAIRTLARAA